MNHGDTENTEEISKTQISKRKFYHGNRENTEGNIKNSNLKTQILPRRHREHIEKYQKLKYQISKRKFYNREYGVFKS